MELPSVPALRTLESPLLQYFVVMPSGHIKRCIFERNITCPYLVIRWDYDKQTNRPIGLKHVSIDPVWEGLGWSSLEDLYRREDRLEDFAEFVKWSDHANSVGGVDPIPNEYLPDEVLRRQREWPKLRKRIELKPPKRSRKAKEEAPKAAKRKRAPKAPKAEG